MWKDDFHILKKKSQDPSFEIAQEAPEEGEEEEEDDEDDVF